MKTLKNIAFYTVAVLLLAIIIGNAGLTMLLTPEIMQVMRP